MARRTIVVDDETWEVYPSGRVTTYPRDEFGLLLQQGTGPERRRRFTRYAPVGNRSPDAALVELSERQLVQLSRESQPAWTAPEGAYGARCPALSLDGLGRGVRSRRGRAARPGGRPRGHRTDRPRHHRRRAG